MAIVQDDELLQMFVEESNEHLDGIEADFLEIEAMGTELDSDLVNKVFRAIHSVKGGAGFLGLDTIKELSHSMENILNKIRNAEMHPGPELISTLLSSLDILKDLIGDFMNSNSVDISEQLEALQQAAEGKSASVQPDAEQKSASAEEQAAEEAAPAAPSEESIPAESQSPAQGDIVSLKNAHGRLLFSLTAEELKLAGQAGRIIYLSCFDSKKDLSDKQRTADDVLKEIESTGMLLNTHADTESAGELQDYSENSSFDFYVLMATVLEEDIVPTLIGLPEEKIYRLTGDMQLKALSGEAALKVETAPAEKAEAQAAPAESPAPPPEAEPAPAESPAPPPAAEPAPEQAARPLPETIAQPSQPAVQPTAAKSARTRSISTKNTTLRVHVNILDRLMNLAGELVLTRNQLIQNFGDKNNGDLEAAIQGVDLITSEMQEAIMSTRMQPVGVVFNKFQRVVHDMSRELGKQVQLEIIGEDVELDKTIIESIGDPLTHLVRNSMDHGIELPEERIQAGKKLPAMLKLSATHEAGQVLINVVDDGGGVDPEKVKAKALETGIVDKAQLESMSQKEIIRLIARPGFSTAKEVTEVSGRGVGMDVVCSNISKLGGSIDIDSTPGVGTGIHIKLPLTLAIIPSLIIRVDRFRFALPQVNLVELVRIPAGQVKKRIEKLEDASVLRLRGELLPVIRLSDVLEIKKSFFDEKTQRNVQDRRRSIADRRSPELGENEETQDFEEKRVHPDRRTHVQSAYNIVVVNAGELNFGLIVDELLDSEEIVVKPLGRHLRSIHTYAGATILGDGSAALILDVMGISSAMKLRVVKERVKEKKVTEKMSQTKDAQSLLIVSNAQDEYFAVPLGLISRLEKIKKSDIEITSGRKTIKYRGGSLILCSIEDVADVQPRQDTENPFVLIFPFAGREVGVLVSQIIDVLDFSMEIDENTFKGAGVLGSAIIFDKTTLLIDLYGIVSALIPDWVEEKKEERMIQKQGQASLLLVEDSKFFLNQIKGFVMDAGYEVLTALDGELALDVLNNPQKRVDLVLTDIEMPNMDGVELTRQIRMNEQWANLPVLALTSVAAEEMQQKARQAGMDDYLIKLDREKVLERITYFLTHGRTD